MGNYLKANAVCYNCGTTKENPDTGYCINGHDNWIEHADSDLIAKFSKENKIDVHEILEAINTNKCLKLKTSHL